MAEEDVRAANAAVQQALKDVEHYTTRIQAFEDSPNFRWDDDRYHAFNDRLQEARAYHLSLTQRAPPALKSPEDPFFSQIGSAKEEEDKNTLTFTTYIPLTNKETMYVRDAYKVIYQAVVTRGDYTRPKYAVVTGTAGVGKSSFLFYVFYKMVQAKMRALFVQYRYYFDGKDMWFLNTMPSRHDVRFWTNDLWCLVDSADPTKELELRVDRCSILLATFPRYDYLKRFRKLAPPPPEFYMPLWSYGELQSIAALYPDVTADKWKERFAVLGGVPRYVLENVSTPPKRLLKQACGVCSLNDALNLVLIDTVPTNKSQAVQTLIHINAQRPYTQPEVRFASLTAIDLMVHHHRKTSNRDVQTLLEAAAGNPLARALRGYIFERHAIKLLERGGEFDCRELTIEAGAPATNTFRMTVPKSGAIFADEVAEGQTLNQLYIPRASNFTSIDAWVPGFGAFQITVAKKHCLRDGTDEILAKLGDDGNKLYWLLPPETFSLFKKQRPLTFNFPQYAIRIPNPEIISDFGDEVPVDQDEDMEEVDD